MPPTKSDKSTGRAKPSPSPDAEDKSRPPQKLNLGCGTFIMGVCVVVLLGKFLPHPNRGAPSAPTTKTGAAKPEPKPVRAAMAPPKPTEPAKKTATVAKPSPTPVRTEAVKSADPPKSETDSGDRPVVFNSPWNGSVWQVERYLKKSLYDAASFEALEWGKVVAHPKGYQVQCKYRSKNVLGVYATQTKTFLLNKNGEVLGMKK